MRAGAMLLAILALSPPRAAAQDTVQVRPRGRAPFGGSTHERAVNLFNDRGTTRMFGDQTIDRRTTIRTDAGVYRGRLEVYGTIDGNLVAVNADVSIYAEAEVRGDVLVVGGTLFVSRRAQVEGSTEEYPDAIGVRERDGMLELTGTRPQRRARDYRLRRSFGQSRATIALTTGGTYNRVEGLPILVGPRLTWTDRSAALRLEGLGVFRTANGLEPDLDNRDMGYAALADLRLGAGREVQLGGRAFDLVQPIEDWQLRADEVGLASLLWHRDFRDYYLSRGLAGFLRLHPTAEITLSGELIRSEASSVAARDPWTLFRNAEPWRPNPLVDEGRFTQVRAALDLDSRPARRWNTGLRLHAEWEHGRSDSLNPRTLPLVRAALPLTDYRYDRVFADLRLFQPMGFGGLQLRAVGGASVGRDDLPIQRRFSLGGPDPMPGFPFRHLACNATVLDVSLPALCDRMVLFQAEYHGGLDINPFDWDWDHRDGSHGRDREHPQWAGVDDWWWDGPQFVLFADAGNAWLARNGWPGRLRWDVGAGLEFGSAAVYAARALEAGEPIRFLVRIHRRF